MSKKRLLIDTSRTRRQLPRPVVADPVCLPRLVKKALSSCCSCFSELQQYGHRNTTTPFPHQVLAVEKASTYSVAERCEAYSLMNCPHDTRTEWLAGIKQRSSQRPVVPARIVSLVNLTVAATDRGRRGRLVREVP
ncbi:unnamed protein product [Arctia plantaginis]|uniref:Uncharacterized protein n=1 Tax=Arctia plantaginis TaxID=874455 RepID=A0A8S1BMM7_ARCPL|nr:unnamed protein product [Arctia plantaginis]